MYVYNYVYIYIYVLYIYIYLSVSCDAVHTPNHSFFILHTYVSKIKEHAFGIGIMCLSSFGTTFASDCS